MRTDFKESMNEFSSSLKEADFDKAMKLKQELVDMNESLTSLDKTKISTVDEFKKNFVFAEVSKNDFSSEVLEDLEIA
jgi:uncharacterized protein YjbI with pentapeptide repeats